MKNQNNHEKWVENKPKWIWSIGHVDNSKLAVEIALYWNNPELLIGDSQHLLIKDKKWTIN